MMLNAELGVNSAQKNSEMKIRGSVGRVTKFTVPQVQDLMD